MTHPPCGSTGCLSRWSRCDSASQVLWPVRCLPRRLDPPRRPGLGERANFPCRGGGVIRRRHPFDNDLERARRRAVGGNIAGDLGVPFRRCLADGAVWPEEVRQEAVVAERSRHRALPRPGGDHPDRRSWLLDWGRAKGHLPDLVVLTVEREGFAAPEPGQNLQALVQHRRPYFAIGDLTDCAKRI